MTATTTGPLVITQPGFYDGIPDADYHADPVPGGSLSSTGARALLPPSCPALFAYQREHPPEPKAHFDLGTAAHTMVLGIGQPVACVEFENWRTNASQEVAAAIRADGGIPLLRKQYDQVRAMAAALRQHPLAAALLDPGRGGRPEVSGFWADPDFGIWRRVRYDWLPPPAPGRLVIPDYKTADTADPHKFARSAASYGYHCQHAWYADAAVALGLDDDPAFVFIVQAKEPPYLVSVVELDAESAEAGRRRNEAAMEIYRDCAAAGIWPGYPADPVRVGLPWWALRPLADYDIPEEEPE